MASSIIKKIIPSLNGVALVGNKTSYDLFGTDYIDKYGSNTAIPNNATTEVTGTRITLTKGTWLINGLVRYPYSNSSNKRNIGIYNTSGIIHSYGAIFDFGPTTSGNNNCAIMTVHIVTAESEVVMLKAYQNSGASITTT